MMNLAELEIALDPALTPQQNAQKYYKNYRKAKTAEEKLTEQIGLAQTELTHIDSVFESLALAENERDLNEIRAELAEQGYVRRKAGKKRPEAACAFRTAQVQDERRLHGACRAQ